MVGTDESFFGEDAANKLSDLYTEKAGRHQHLWPGVQLHHLAAGQDEPRHPGIEGQIVHGDTFHNDRHPDLNADFILANLPFNVSDWGGERLREDRQWQFGKPPVGNANFAWVHQFIHHLVGPNWNIASGVSRDTPAQTWE